jgi:ketosteroid isomerase-like protein
MAQWETAIDRRKAAYKAWHDSKGASAESWIELMADRVDFRSLANGRLGVPWTRTRTSPEEVREYPHGLTSDFAMEHYTVDRYVCQDDTIVAIGSTAWHHKISGKRIDTPKVDVWRVKDGRVIAFFEYYDTAEVAAAAAAVAWGARSWARITIAQGGQVEERHERMVESSGVRGLPLVRKRDRGPGRSR